MENRIETTIGLLSKRNNNIAVTSLKNSRKEIFFSELHSLLVSGLDFSRAFHLLIDGEKDKNVRDILSLLYQKVVAGNSLAQALDGCGKFTTLDCGVVRIGEETGRLSDALLFLVDYYRKKISQTRMVSSAVSYPLVILGMAIVVVIFMLIVIVPMFEQVYSRMGGELPGMTQWIISLSRKFPHYMTFTLVILGCAGILLYIFRTQDSIRSTISKLILKIPMVGDMVRKSYEASFCKLLYLLTGSGIPLLAGLEMLRSIIRFYPYECSLDTVAKGLEKGESFSANLEKFPNLYDSKLTTLLRVGEETSHLPQMLHKQGEDLTKELEHRLHELGNFLEPILILFVGALVAIILISMYLPMFKLGGIME